MTPLDELNTLVRWNVLQLTSLDMVYARSRHESGYRECIPLADMDHAPGFLLHTAVDLSEKFRATRYHRRVGPFRFLRRVW